MLQTETIDETIGQIERLYRTLTGREAPPGGEQPYAAIPPERAPEEHVGEQLDRLVESLGELSGRRSALAPWTPPVSVWETPKEVLILVDLPGVTREAVKLHVTQGMLEVTGERVARPASATDSAKLVYLEHGKGTFRRVMPLPPGVAVDELQAQMKDGVLEVRMPRAAAASSAKTVPVS